MKEGTVMSLYLNMLKQHEHIEQKINRIEQQLKRLPQGDIFCAKNGTTIKWYYHNGTYREYIPKKKKKIAEQLAYKKYLVKLLKELEQEKNAIEQYLKKCRKEESEAENMLLLSSNYRSLILPYYKPMEERLYEWQTMSYQRNEKYPEKLIHESKSGNLLRSKSECMIDEMLYRAGLPYRYDCALQLGETTIYPDFTIIHPESKKVYYWEHFGKMDDASYAQKTFYKLGLYNSNGIVPSINLIMTFETENNPLNMITVEKVINQYFGDIGF